MIYEHEIPAKSRLYFSNSAKIKRKIEFEASLILDECGYEEIVTPYFSYHQHQKIDEKQLIRVSDQNNHILTLRADSTIDVVRLITKRLGRAVSQKKWFYIQPTFHFPTNEQYQIGAEFLENMKLEESINDSVKIIGALDIKPHLQISNMMIPKLLSKHLDIPISIFEEFNLQEIFGLDIPWLSKLASISCPEDIEKLIDDVPDYLVDELEKIKRLCESIEYEDIIVAPLFYAKMRYYDGLFFRYFLDNKKIGMGGTYRYEDIYATGFALYCDNIVEELVKR
jgi:ATP phosphoribosyltransferase regulatory subunit HisZ